VNTETILAMSTFVIWSRVVQSRDVSPYNFYGLVMSNLPFSVALCRDDANLRRSLNHRPIQIKFSSSQN